MFDEATVRNEIRKLIARKEQKMKELERERKGIDKEKKPTNHAYLTLCIERLSHSIMTLIELEHNLRLCDCPPEAYEGKGVE